jgi:hypothetical protein
MNERIGQFRSCGEKPIPNGEGALSITEFPQNYMDFYIKLGQLGIQKERRKVESQATHFHGWWMLTFLEISRNQI